MPASETPAISVVVASFSGEAALTRCLESLVPQAPAELIVPTTLGNEAVRFLRARFPTARFIEAPHDAGVFRLRSLGLREARGEAIALTEDHCTAAPEWLGAFTRAFRSGWSVVGGPVENGVTDTAREWALYLCEYAALMPPLPEGTTRFLSAVNTAYSRELLLACRPTWEEAFHDNEVHDTLRHTGLGLYRCAGARVESHLQMGMREAMRHLFSGGRRFGSYRRARSMGLLRALWIMVSPAVPVVLLARTARVVLLRRPGRFLTFLRALPYILLLLTAWSAGEALGYVSPGPGSRLAHRSQGA